MPIHNFDHKQEFVSIDKIPDFRSEEERNNSLLSTYNHQSNDIAYAERMAEEVILLSGAWVTVHPRAINNGNRDEVWDEDADPKYLRGTKMKGFFAPKPVETELTKWGVDAPNQTTIWFSRAQVYKTFGSRMISEGDLIILPHNTMAVTQNDGREGIGTRMDRFRVLNSSDQGMFKYRWIYWTCVLENLSGDVTIDVDYGGEKT